MNLDNLIEQKEQDMALTNESQPEKIPIVDADDFSEPTQENDGLGNERLEEVPLPSGIVGETAHWILDRCEKPFRPFGILAALSVWSLLLARRVRFQNQTPVFYGIMAATTSNGKDTPPRLVRTILQQIGLSSSHFCGRLSSWNAGIETLARCWQHPAVLSLADEAAGYLDMARAGRYGLLDLLKTGWSSTLGMLDPQGRTKKAGSTQLTSIHHPALSMLMSAQPNRLGEAVRSSQLDDGFLPRSIWAVRRDFVTTIDEVALDQSHRLEDTEEGRRILHRGREIWNWLCGNDAQFGTMAKLEALPAPQPGKEDIEPVRHEVWAEPVSFDANTKARTIFSDFVRLTQKQIKPAADGMTGPQGFLWGKAAENAKRLALLLAAARCAALPGIENLILESEAIWAVRFVEASVRDGIQWSRDNMADTHFQKRVKTVLAFIQRQPGQMTTKSRLTRGLQHSCSTRDLNDVLESLLQAGTVECIYIRTPGRTAEGYRLVKPSTNRDESVQKG